MASEMGVGKPTAGLPLDEPLDNVKTQRAPHKSFCSAAPSHIRGMCCPCGVSGSPSEHCILVHKQLPEQSGGLSNPGDHSE